MPELEEPEAEEEPQDAVPQGWEDEPPALFPASTAPRTRTPALLPLTGRVVTYIVAAGWPFIGAYAEFVRLDDAHAVDLSMCSEGGCALASHVYVEQGMGWTIPLSLISVVVVAALFRLRRFVRSRHPVPSTNDGPVNRFLLAGIFLGICTLAFLVGILRGVIISRFGH